MFFPIFLNTIVMLLMVIIALFLVNQNRRPFFALLFLVVYLVDGIVNILPFVFDFQPEGLIYNWIGQSLKIAWVLIFLWLCPLKAKDIGLTFKQRSGTILPAVLVTIGVIAFKVVLTALFSASPPGELLLETVLFQIIMPPLAQELLHSGLLLSLMIIALGGTEIDQKFEWNRVIVLAVILTAVSHGIKFGLRFDAGLQFNFIVFLTPFIGKLVYAWLRLSTGSLLFPILAYSLSNLGVLFIPYLLI